MKIRDSQELSTKVSVIKKYHLCEMRTSFAQIHLFQPHFFLREIGRSPGFGLACAEIYCCEENHGMIQVGKDH